MRNVRYVNVPHARTVFFLFSLVLGGCGRAAAPTTTLAFADDPRPAAVLAQFATALAGDGDLAEVLGPDGLTVYHHGSVHAWPAASDPLADPNVLEWEGEAGGLPALATFTDQVVPSFLGAWDDADRQIGVDRFLAGPEAAPHVVPPDLSGYHYLAVHDPGDDPQYEGLDWVTWLVFFEPAAGGWKVVAMLVDSWAP